MTPLTLDKLYEFTSSLLLGYRMDQTLFSQLLDLSKGNREQMRSWVILRKEDSSQNAGPTINTAFLNPLNLPSRFLNFYSPKRSVVLASGDVKTFRFYDQIPLERKFEWKDDDSKFYVDYAGSKLYLCGTIDQQYSVHIYHIASSPDITDTNAWIFPAQFHPILACDIAEWYRTNFDYDVVNVSQAQYIEKLSKLIYSRMIEWDGMLQEGQIEGVDYPTDNTRPGFISNTVGDNIWS